MILVHHHQIWSISCGSQSASNWSFFCRSLESCIRFAEDEELELILGIEKNVQKDVARCVDPAKITFARDVLDSWMWGLYFVVNFNHWFFSSTFNDLHLYKEPLEKVVTELSVMYALCCRQRPDMFRLVQLVKDKCKDLHNCRPRMVRQKMTVESI